MVWQMEGVASVSVWDLIQTTSHGLALSGCASSKPVDPVAQPAPVPDNAPHLVVIQQLLACLGGHSEPIHFDSGSDVVYAIYSVDTKFGAGLYGSLGG